MARMLMLLTVALAIGGFVPAATTARPHKRSHAACHHRRHRRHNRCRHRRHHKRHTHKHTQTTQPAGQGGHGKFVQPSPGSAGQASQSNNWSGYVQGSLEQGGTPPKQFNSIGGDWTVPKVSQHTAGQAEYSSDWIGIGGGCIDAGCTATDTTLIQTGTEQDVDSSGHPSYSVWWEVVPGPSLTITSMTVGPGDRMSASIAEAVPESNLWTITIRDLTNGQSYTTTVAYSSSHATAEWIEETPLILGADAGFASLPSLSAPGFDHATTDGAPANLKAAERMDLVDQGGRVIATASTPDPDADGFNVCTWAGACTAPAGS